MEGDTGEVKAHHAIHDVAVEAPGAPKQTQRPRKTWRQRLWRAFLVIYRRPLVRCDWGVEQEDVQTEWTDLFLDLIYVGAAYRLGFVLAYGEDGHSPTCWESILWFVALFFLLYHGWISATDFSSRFVTHDIFHRIFEMVSHANIAFCVSQIRPIGELRDARNGYMFWISFSMALDKLLVLVRFLEVHVQASYILSKKQRRQHRQKKRQKKHKVSCPIELHKIETEKEESVWKRQKDREVHANRIRSTSARTYILYSVQILLLFAAMMASKISGYQHEHNHDDDGHSYYYGNSTDDDDDHRRFLASVDDHGSADDDSDDKLRVVMSAPMLVLGLWLACVVFNFFYVLIVMVGKLTRAQNSLPMHLAYVLHRHGEWLMLMIGEAVFSLLLITNHTSDADTTLDRSKYTTFIFSFLIAQFIQFMGYSFDAWSPEVHAIKRRMRAGAMWYLVKSCYYCAVLAVGVGLKTHLSYVYDKPQVQWARLLFFSHGLQYVIFLTGRLFHVRHHELSMTRAGMYVEIPGLCEGMNVDRMYPDGTRSAGVIRRVREGEQYDVEYRKDEVVECFVPGDSIIPTDKVMDVKPGHGVGYLPPERFEELSDSEDTSLDFKQCIKVRYFAFDLPSDYVGRPMHTYIHTYVTGGFLEYFRQFPTRTHARWLPIIWALQGGLIIATFRMPQAHLKYQYNTLVLLIITIAETLVQWFESLLDAPPPSHHGGHGGHKHD